MLVNSLAPLPLTLVSIMLPYPYFTPKSILSFRSLLDDIHSIFLLLIFASSLFLSLIFGQKMPVGEHFSTQISMCVVVFMAKQGQISCDLTKASASKPKVKAIIMVLLS